MNTEIHIPYCVTVVFRCRHQLADDESTLAILGSDKALGSWNPRNPAFARRVGNDFWEAHVYLDHGAKVWWKWLILDPYGEEKCRESIPDRCLQVDGDSLSITAYWNKEMIAQKTWEGETRTCCPPPTSNTDPGKSFKTPAIVYSYPPPYASKTMITPKEHWDLFKDYRYQNKSNVKPSVAPYSWVDSENKKAAFLARSPTSGLGSSLHSQQMAAAEEREKLATLADITIDVLEEKHSPVGDRKENMTELCENNTYTKGDKGEIEIKVFEVAEDTTINKECPSEKDERSKYCCCLWGRKVLNSLYAFARRLTYLF